VLAISRIGAIYTRVFRLRGRRWRHAYRTATPRSHHGRRFTRRGNLIPMKQTAMSGDYVPERRTRYRAPAHRDKHSLDRGVMSGGTRPLCRVARM